MQAYIKNKHLIIERSGDVNIRMKVPVSKVCADYDVSEIFIQGKKIITGDINCASLTFEQVFKRYVIENRPATLDMPISPQTLINSIDIPNFYEIVEFILDDDLTYISLGGKFGFIQNVMERVKCETMEPDDYLLTQLLFVQCKNRRGNVWMYSQNRNGRTYLIKDINTSVWFEDRDILLKIEKDNYITFVLENVPGFEKNRTYIAKKIN